MKTIQLFLFVFILFISCKSETSYLNASSALRTQTDEKVLICVSKTAYAYHKESCSGFEKCTHETKEITISEAKEMDRKPCKICYK